jgi:hypothetical protein
MKKQQQRLPFSGGTPGSLGEWSSSSTKRLDEALAGSRQNIWSSSAAARLAISIVCLSGIYFFESADRRRTLDPTSADALSFSPGGLARSTSSDSARECRA